MRGVHEATPHAVIAIGKAVYKLEFVAEHRAGNEGGTSVGTSLLNFPWVVVSGGHRYFTVYTVSFVN